MAVAIARIWSMISRLGAVSINSLNAGRSKFQPFHAMTPAAAIAARSRAASVGVASCRRR